MKRLMMKTIIDYQNDEREKVLLDVRDKQEFEKETYPGARNWYWEELIKVLEETPEEFTQQFDKSVPIYLLCYTGLHSDDLADILEEMGYEVYSLYGGWGAYMKWKFENYVKEAQAENELSGEERVKEIERSIVKKFRKEIDEFNDWLFPHVNNGHYRMAFCQSPEAYDEAYEDFYESLDKLDKRLETNRFLFGDYITDSDVRAYVTLIRWDVSYFHNVGPVKKPIRDYKNIWGYLKELYAIPAFRHGSDPQVLALSRPGKKLGEVLFRGYNERILAKVDFEKLMADDGSRRTLSKTPDEVFLRHPEGETYEDYAGEISKTIWNSPKWEDRNPKNGVLSVDASINPLKGLL